MVRSTRNGNKTATIREGCRVNYIPREVRLQLAQNRYREAEELSRALTPFISTQ